MMHIILLLKSIKQGHNPALLFLLLFIPFNALSSNNTQETGVAYQQMINQQWLYLEQDLQDVGAVNKEKNWQPVTLPHSWNSKDTLDSVPGYRRSASWYKRHLTLAKIKAKKTILYFEGANFETKLYVNQKLVGEHIGGYLGFEFDISEYVTAGENEILVRVSNAYNKNLIPSQKADFFLHGGITRDVWLKQYPDVYLQDLVVKTPKVSHQQANTTVTFSTNTLPTSADYEVIASLYAPDKTLIETKKLSQLGVENMTVEFSTLSAPKLWSPDHPNLYQVSVKLFKNKQLQHAITENIGYRWFEMRANKGFFINGERVLIRGTHRHEEHAGLGAALSNEQHRKDMEQIKEMGANFVRLAHYPQDPEVYKAANELGLVLWDELPWCRGGKGGHEWEQNTERLLRAQIKQNINHPSIAFWSLGNEIYWEEDFVGGGRDEVIMPYLTKLNSLVKQLDPTRLTTIRKYYPSATLVDAFSPSIWAGWYGGAYDQYEEALTTSMKKYPTFLHMEYGGSSHVGRHTETPISSSGIAGGQVSVSEAMNQAIVKSVAKDSDWNENYMVDLFDWHLRASEQMPNFAGNAQWAFKDFGTPLRPLNPIPFMNQKGLVDASGKPKDAYYVFKSYWSKEPFCYIESKTWTHRNGPKEGRNVNVYCNTEQAELSLNGKSLGVKTNDKSIFPAGGLVWKVPFISGKNTLEVTGFNGKNNVAQDTLAITYLTGKHGKYDHISLTSTPLSNGNMLITAEAQDSKGNRVLDYSERAYFSNLEGHGELLEHYGTPTRSSIIEMASGVASIEFVPDENSPATIEFRSQNIKGVYIVIDKK
ncbi:glycoside hydrolase family 2 protein [Thalassotalea sp. PLHSN55]|uniref:glycoside hydrolase family 2 protein n=1 Tax=Thalassotalea sp. PLHSN55 TaxID=3435888 RepID=UPI003F875EC6